MLVSERKALLRLNERSRWMPEGHRGDRAERSLRAQRNFLEAFPPSDGRKVAIYSAVRGEVGTDRIRDVYLAEGARLFYPRVAADGNLSFFLNLGYKANDNPQRGVIELPARMLNRNCSGRCAVVEATSA